MSVFFEKNLKLFESKEKAAVFQGIKRGFEKESLRVDREGILAQTKHPKDLGSSLTHPFITTDYSEALLEFITPPSTDLQEPFARLQELHAFTYQVLQEEMLWTASMPCRLPKEEEIPIAEYGHSNVGQLKYIYRKGLGKRYGRSMQTIAGIHYNFSLPEDFFQILYHAQCGNNHNGTSHSSNNNNNSNSNSHNQTNTPVLKDFISEQYLALIRNSLRWGWILPLLFGATPAICGNFFYPKAKIAEKLQLLNKNTVYGPYATSLRLSDLGYHNKADSAMLVSYNSFPEFLQTMHKAVHTQDPTFAKIGILSGDEYQQLNDSILQTEDEHYALVRPKRVSMHGERTLSALMREGIEYIEIRALDINPFLPLGIEPRTTFILDAFLMTCLFLESPPIDSHEMARIQSNQYCIVTEGRNPNLQITDQGGQQKNAGIMARDFLKLMYKAATCLDQAYGITDFSTSSLNATNVLDNLNNLPSTEIIQCLKKENISYFDFVKKLSIQHKNYFKGLHFSAKLVQYYQSLAKESLIQQAEMERRDSLPFVEFLAKFLAP